MVIRDRDPWSFANTNHDQVSRRFRQRGAPFDRRR